MSDHSDIDRGLLALSKWIDESPGYADIASEEHLWRRVTKAASEANEARDALAGYVGENPRKGVTHGLDDVVRELLDTAVAALGAVVSIGGNDPEEHVLDLLAAHLRTVTDRAGLVVEPGLRRCDRCGVEIPAVAWIDDYDHAVIVEEEPLTVESGLVDRETNTVRYVVHQNARFVLCSQVYQ